MLNKKRIIFILIGLIALMVLSLVIFRPPADKALPLPILTASPSSTIQPPYITYSEDKRNQLIDIMKNRPQVSGADQTLREKLISQLGNKSGVITQTPDYVIKYVKAPNIFQVQILTTEYIKIKTQATEWFINQGFSQDGICKLPIQFFLSAKVKDSLQDSIENFNYLPEGC